MNIKIPESTIENYIYSNFSEAKLSKSKEINFNSPFVNDGKKRLYVNPSKESYFDQKEQKGGTFINFVMRFEGIDEKSAYLLLLRNYSQSGTFHENFQEIIEIEKKLELPTGMKFFFEQDTLSRSGKLAKAYLTKRGIFSEDFGYVYDPHGDFKETYHNRVIFPFYEEGKLVYYIGRDIGKSKLRYKNPSGLDAGNFVFQIDKLTDDVFIFEGVTDALSLKEPQVGTAMLSNKMKMTQIVKILDRAPKRIIFVTENDTNETAIKAGKKNLEWNIKTLLKYKPASINIKIYTYNPPIGYKDFNALAAKTGKHFIDIEKECIEWKPKRFDVSKIKWGIR